MAFRLGQQGDDNNLFLFWDWSSSLQTKSGEIWLQFGNWRLQTTFSAYISKNIFRLVSRLKSKFNLTNYLRIFQEFFLRASFILIRVWISSRGLLGCNERSDVGKVILSAAKCFKMQLITLAKLWSWFSQLLTQQWWRFLEFWKILFNKRNTKNFI